MNLELVKQLQADKQYPFGMLSKEEQDTLKDAQNLGAKIQIYRSLSRGNCWEDLSPANFVPMMSYRIDPAWQPPVGVWKTYWFSPSMRRVSCMKLHDSFEIPESELEYWKNDPGDEYAPKIPYIGDIYLSIKDSIPKVSMTNDSVYRWVKKPQPVEAKKTYWFSPRLRKVSDVKIRIADMFEIPESEFEYWKNDPGENFEPKIPAIGDTFIPFYSVGQKQNLLVCLEELGVYRWVKKQQPVEVKQPQPAKGWHEYPVEVCNGWYAILYKDSKVPLHEMPSIVGFGGILFEGWTYFLPQLTYTTSDGMPKKPLKVRIWE